MLQLEALYLHDFKEWQILIMVTEYSTSSWAVSNALLVHNDYLIDM